MGHCKQFVALQGGRLRPVINVLTCIQVHDTWYCIAVCAGSSEEGARYKHVQVWIDSSWQVQNKVWYHFIGMITMFTCMYFTLLNYDWLLCDVSSCISCCNIYVIGAHFSVRLKEYPQYCQFLASIPHFGEFPSNLKEVCCNFILHLFCVVLTVYTAKLVFKMYFLWMCILGSTSFVTLMWHILGLDDFSQAAVDYSCVCICAVHWVWC